MVGEALTERFTEITLNAFRIAFGLMFMQHGAQKFFAMFGREEPVVLMSQMGLAGVLEFYGGLLIVLGLLTRPVAFLLSGQMAWAYFQAHFPRGWIPIENRGEFTVLVSFAFLHLAIRGGGSFSLDGPVGPSGGFCHPGVRLPTWAPATSGPGRS